MPTTIDTLVVRRIAVDADVDARSVKKEVRRALGEALPAVRGRAGERIRSTLPRYGIQPAPAHAAEAQ